MAGGHRRLSVVFISIKSITAFRTAEILINRGKQFMCVPARVSEIKNITASYARIIMQYKHKIN